MAYSEIGTFMRISLGVSQTCQKYPGEVGVVSLAIYDSFYKHLDNKLYKNGKKLLGNSYNYFL